MGFMGMGNGFTVTNAGGCISSLSYIVVHSQSGSSKAVEKDRTFRDRKSYSCDDPSEAMKYVWNACKIECQYTTYIWPNMQPLSLRLRKKKTVDPLIPLLSIPAMCHASYSCPPCVLLVNPIPFRHNPTYHHETKFPNPP